MSLVIRPIEHNDIESCGRIGYEAHKAISSTHGYPSEQPSVEFGIGLINSLLDNPNSWGVLAERHGKTLGSIFLVLPGGVADPDPDNPWRIIEPPYFYSYGDRWDGHSGDATFGTPYIVHFENHMTGEISCRSQLLIHNPGDYASYSSSATSALLIDFQMPASGRIDAWSYLECVGSSYNGQLLDEYGWSDGDVAQTSRYFMVTGSPPDYDYATSAC